MIARQTLNIYVQYLKHLPRLRRYSLVIIKAGRPRIVCSHVLKFLSAVIKRLVH